MTPLENAEQALLEEQARHAETQKELADAKMKWGVAERSCVSTEAMLKKYMARADAAENTFRTQVVLSLLAGGAMDSAGHTATYVASRAVEIADAVIRILRPEEV